MSLNDPLANVLSHVLNCENQAKEECIISPNSKLVRGVLDILQKNHYIGSYEVIEEARGGSLKVHLVGGLNKAGVIKPRFSFTKTNHEKFEKRYLPAKDFGLLVISTSKGLMTHVEALEKGIGGKLIAYCY